MTTRYPKPDDDPKETTVQFTEELEQLARKLVSAILLEARCTGAESAPDPFSVLSWAEICEWTGTEEAGQGPKPWPKDPGLILQNLFRAIHPLLGTWDVLPRLQELARIEAGAAEHREFARMVRHAQNGETLT